MSEKAMPDHTVPYETVLSVDASQALRARLRSCCPSGTRYILRAEALIKLALGVNLGPMRIVEKLRFFDRYEARIQNESGLPSNNVYVWSVISVLFNFTVN